MTEAGDSVADRAMALLLELREENELLRQKVDILYGDLDTIACTKCDRPGYVHHHDNEGRVIRLRSIIWRDQIERGERAPA